MNDSIFDHLGWIIFIVICGIVLGLASITIHDQMQIPIVAERYHVDKADLEAFISNSDYTVDEFDASPAVRKNFESWCKGDMPVKKKSRHVVIPIFMSH